MERDRDVHGLPPGLEDDFAPVEASVPAWGGPDDELLTGLTPPQKQAALHVRGPLLILAAAGSGKTRTLTRRVAHLIRTGVPPWQILAMTFTNKAAGEMRERIHGLLGGSGDSGESRATRGLTVTTFHALCARLLRRYVELAVHSGLNLGVKPDYTIYDSGDQSALMKRVLEGLGLSGTNWPPRSVLSSISTAKNELKTAAEFSREATDFYAKTIAKAYEAYDKALRAANAVDFDDLLLLTARMLRESAPVREECQARWRYLLIDEYQDTNKAQFLIAAMLAGQRGGPGREDGPNICVVGDPDQAIYGWRGADIRNILDFEEQFPGCRTIMLGENFRSTAPILKVADTLVKHNTERKDKPLFTSKAGGEAVECVLCRDERHEASLVVDWLRERHEAGLAWKDLAVFYRTNALSRVMEEAMRTAGVPYTIARGTAFYDREEVKNALAYLRVVANQADDVSLSRILNVPTRGIGGATEKAVELAAAAWNVPLMEALRRIGDGEKVDGLTSRSVPAVQKFVGLIDSWTGHGSFWAGEEAGSGQSLHALVERIVKESGLEKMYGDQAKQSKSETDEERLDNLDELVSSARQFELEYDPAGDPMVGVVDGGGVPPLLAMLRGYLESVALVADADAVDPGQGAATLMTLHAAKGLEFGAAAMIGLEEGLLPHMRARESEAMLEEERRLAFVGITRAMTRLLITSSKYRTVRGMTERQIPSRFLEELGREGVTFSDQSDSLGEMGRGGDAWTGESDSHDRDVALRRGVPPSILGATRAGSGGGAKFPIGCMVRHPQFGLGKVISVQSGANARASIQFRDVGVKTLVLEYARLERVGG